MPRKDGFPTNEELLIDFNRLGGQLFAAAYNSKFAGEAIPTYINKRIGQLVLKVTKINFEAQENSGVSGSTIVREDLEMRLANDGDAEALEGDHLRWKGNEEYVHQALFTHKMLGHCAVGDYIDPATIPPFGVITRWNGYRRNDPVGFGSRRVHTLTEKPSKLSIVSGKYMAEEALDYVQSTAFNIPRPVRVLYAATGGDADHLEFSHAWKVPHNRDVEYTGYESLGYLEAGKREIESRLTKREERLAKAQADFYPERIVDEWARVVDETRAQLDRINQAIAMNRLRNAIGE